MDNTHKTMKPDFFCGCHGNQEPTDQEFSHHNLKMQHDLKKKKKTLNGFVATVIVANWCKFGCSAIFRFGVTFVPATQVCDFYHFEI